MRSTNQQQLLLLCNTCAKPCTLHSAHDCGVCTGIGGSGRSKNFEKGQGGGRQFISSFLIYRKCAQRNICLSHGKKWLFEKKYKAMGAVPYFSPSESATDWWRPGARFGERVGALALKICFWLPPKFKIWGTAGTQFTL